jgi:HD-GYP domain-containing protein (c-di-GMP phosphodiesterase class II)
VADTFDSMTTDRPYRRRLADAAAIREIEACFMTQFDPVVVEAFLKAYRAGRIVKRPVDAMELIG